MIVNVSKLSSHPIGVKKDGYTLHLIIIECIIIEHKK
jgi:hypothetical protein